MPELGRQFRPPRTDLEPRATPLQYGIPVAVDARGPGSLKGAFVDVRPYQRRDVPLSSLRATQARINPDHAEAIAQTSQRNMERRKKRPTGYLNPLDNSVWLEDGHHRAVGAAIRGDDVLNTEIKGYVAPAWQGIASGRVITRKDAEEHLGSKAGTRA